MNLFYAHTCISGYTNQIVFIIDRALPKVGGGCIKSQTKRAFSPYN